MEELRVLSIEANSFQYNVSGIARQIREQYPEAHMMLIVKQL
jgi:hypothetical protein